MANSALPIGFKTFPAAPFLLGDAYDKLFVKPYQRGIIVESLKLLDNEETFKRLQTYLYQRAKDFTLGSVLNKWISLLNNK